MALCETCVAHSSAAVHGTPGFIVDFRINDLLSSLATTFGCPARCDVENFEIFDDVFGVQC